MGLIKDWREETKHYTLWAKITSLKEMKRVCRYRKQRIERGWSDRDCWDAGSYILKITSDMLKELYCEKDNGEYFELNIDKPSVYKNFKQVADDIDEYLAFKDTDYTIYLDFDLPTGYVDEDGTWQTNSTEDQTEKMRAAMKKHQNEFIKKSKKATRAMKFVAVNHVKLWW